MNESSAPWTHFLPAIVKSDLVNDFPQKAPREKGRNWFGWTADLWQNVHLCNFTNTHARKCVWGVVCPVKPSVTHNTVPVVCVFLCQGCGLPEMLTECSLLPPPPHPPCKCVCFWNSYTCGDIKKNIVVFQLLANCLFHFYWIKAFVTYLQPF